MQKIILKGLGVSAGISKGRVKVIKQSTSEVDFNRGDILVTKITDPSMVMLMSKAGAIIADIGGMTSHPAIVSREMGIPCVVATKTATSILSDDMEVQVNGTTGEIFIEDDNSSKEVSVQEKDYQDFIEAFKKGYATMDTDTFTEAGSTDYTALDPLIAESWMQKVKTIIEEINKSGLTDLEIAKLLHSPSTMRNTAIFDLFMAGLAGLPKEGRLAVADLYIRPLKAICREDPFALNGKNVIHSNGEIIDMASRAMGATPDIAIKLGRLINACYHMGYSLFGDMNPQLVYENYGPYDVKKNGEACMAVVKEFKNFQPIEFWPETSKLPIKSVRVVALYQDVNFSIDAVTHTSYEGDTINGLKYYALEINGRPVPIDEAVKASDVLERYSAFLWQIFQSFDEAEFKKIYLHQKSYVYKNLCERLGLDWLPTEELLNEIASKPLMVWPQFQTAKERDRHMVKIIDPLTDFSG